jgi:hypothetical protein
VSKVVDAQIIPREYLSTLARVVAEAQANGDVESSRTDAESVATTLNIQEVLRRYGYSVSTGPAEEIYRMYSQNKWASWISGGCMSIEGAVMVLKELCHDILFGENHIGM